MRCVHDRAAELGAALPPAAVAAAAARCLLMQAPLAAPAGLPAAPGSSRVSAAAYLLACMLAPMPLRTCALAALLQQPLLGMPH
jgi:hypothetical protein